MSDECLICKEPLEYLNEGVVMKCEICGKEELSNLRCVNGHYVCSECHTEGLDGIFGICLSSSSKDPVKILDLLMSQPFCHMHGPEHHIMVGAALLTAYKNAGGDIDLEAALREMKNRGMSVPFGACGFWGACGAGISTGIFVSIVTGSTPLAEEYFGLSNQMTATALDSVGRIGGPRCCKRDSYLSVLAAVDFVERNMGIHMDKSDPVCIFSSQNNQCLGFKCPFSFMNIP